MKFIYLGAGKNEVSLNSDADIPKCLALVNDEETVLEHAISILDDLKINDRILVGGFQIEKIIENFHSFKIFYNKNWNYTNSLYSLYLAKNEFIDDLIISYSDIVYNKDIIQNVQRESNLVIATDSCWQKRYYGRSEKNFIEADKVYKDNGNLVVTKDELDSDIVGEFIGVIYLKKEIALKIKENFDDIIKLYGAQDGTINNLINYCVEYLNIDVDYVDIKGEWAELDNKQDLEQFKFGTKADTLKNIEKLLSLSNVLPQFSFTVKEFLDKEVEIIGSIKSKFFDKKLVVRSSAQNEDSAEESMAGNFLSVLNVNNDFYSVKDAIEQVIASYSENKSKDDLNQILVQEQVENVCMSGVVFTKNINTNAPYYIINYENTTKTDTITSGTGKTIETLIYYNKSKQKVGNQFLENLILAVDEIENVTNNSMLDIEFAISTEGKIYIFQVRPIAALKNTPRINEDEFGIELNNLKSFFLENSVEVPFLHGKNTIYGVMPDWNPAEIIGIDPSPLALSLYKTLITDHIWGESRNLLGYINTKGNIGIKSFSEKPYVDVRMSFNSLIPTNIPKTIARKLAEFYLNKLESNPLLHDKIEFEIVFSVFDFNIDNRLKELKEYGFTAKEIKIIKERLVQFTSDIITEKRTNIRSMLELTEKLQMRRESILNSELPVYAKIFMLLEDCKKYGTLPFAILARLGFVSNIQLKSLLNNNIISQQFYDDFFTSINTVTQDYISDLDLYFSNDMSKQDFLSKYGHLRPGTYDITSFSYKENFDEYVRFKDHNKHKDTCFDNNISVTSKIDAEIDKHNLGFDAVRLFDFISDAIGAREKAKFEFTKSLSLILDLLVEMFEHYSLSREDISYLKIQQIFDFNDGSVSSNIENELKKIISYNKKKYKITKSIQLPNLICKPSDFDYFFIKEAIPNFITEKVIRGESIVLDNNTTDIEGKIIIIENADPGYDWIFGYNIKGLVTKYGGVASHMAIRCAEFQIPAAIGCGELIYNTIKSYKLIELNCKLHQISKIL